MATPQKIREMKHTIQQFQIQLQQKINIFKRLRHQRNQYRITIKDLTNQITQL